MNKLERSAKAKALNARAGSTGLGTPYIGGFTDGWEDGAKFTLDRIVAFIERDAETAPSNGDVDIELLLTEMAQELKSGGHLG